MIGRIRDGDVIRVDGEAGRLEVLVDATELAARPAPQPDLTSNTHGMGRELFAGFRALAARADLGAGAFGTAA
jgi:phosphogluconate dehydratase